MVQGTEVAQKMTFFVTNAISFFISGQILWDWVLRDEVSAWSLITGMVHFGFTFLGFGYWFDAFSNPSAVIRKKDKAPAPIVPECKFKDASEKEPHIDQSKEIPMNENKEADDSDPKTDLKKSDKKPPLPFNFSEESDPNHNKQGDDDENSDQIKTFKTPPPAFNFDEESSPQSAKELEQPPVVPFHHGGVDTPTD